MNIKQEVILVGVYQTYIKIFTAFKIQDTNMKYSNYVVALNNICLLYLLLSILFYNFDASFPHGLLKSELVPIYLVLIYLEIVSICDI